MKRPELLAPAGNYENAFFALKYGADAIFQGLDGFSLRRTAKAELGIEELTRCAELAHSLGKKHYLAINLFAHEADIVKLKAISQKLKAIKTDAFIVSDPGIFLILKEQLPDAEFHLSTQANTLNSAAVKFWQKQGIIRVILARELTKEDIVSIRDNTSIGLEIFVHGAMCMSYSGRCHLSNYFLGRDANSGECAQPCRWEYKQKDEGRGTKDDKMYVEIEEDEKGTYILNSKDLCLVEKIPELMEIGIDSFKIEGRNKTSYYVANVVRVYRAVIDECLQGKLREDTLAWAKQELTNISHRDYSTGFYDGEKGSFNFESSGYIKDTKMVGIAYSDSNQITIDVRDKIEAGDVLEFLFPGEKEAKSVLLEKMKDANKDAVLSVAHNRTKVLIPNKFGAFEQIIVRKNS